MSEINKINFDYLNKSPAESDLLKFAVLKLKKGDTLSQNITFTKADGTVKNISNLTLKITFRKNKTTTAVLNKTFLISNNIDSQNGIYLLVLTATEMNFTEGLYWGEMQLYDATQIEYTTESSNTFILNLQPQLID